MGKKRFYALLCVAALVVGVALGGIFARVILSRGEDSEIARQLKLANRYLLEQNYEEAIIAFQKVLELEPRQMTAYLGLAEAYIGDGQEGEAVSVLEAAQQQIELAFMPEEDLFQDTEEVLLYLTELYEEQGEEEKIEKVQKQLDRVREEGNKSYHEEKTDVTEESYAEKYLREKILSEYENQPSEINLTYYTQTYEKKEVGYTTYITEDNLYCTDQMDSLLITYNIEDYDKNGVDDLITVTLEMKDNAFYDYSSITKENSVKTMVLYHHFYFFDENGKVRGRHRGNGNFGSVVRTPEIMTFIFSENKEITIISYDDSVQNDGNVLLPVTDDVSTHVNSISIREYDINEEDFKKNVHLSRYEEIDDVLYSTGINENIYRKNSNSEKYVKSEEEAIAHFNKILTDEMFFDLEIPKASWENRWDTDFKVKKDTNYKISTLILQPTNCELCYTTNSIKEKKGSDLGNLIGATTGNMTIQVKTRENSENFSELEKIEAFDSQEPPIPLSF